jgi:galactofuranosylgalactofuranosylrhamnosyl-N-acetylglucosaminyl-diphospho-decaprenol beta-1,5/1,6-galactofuranosyltransferase
MSHVIQHLVMPNLAFGAPEEMYVRPLNDKVHALMSEGRLLFDAGGRASFDTFFNSVTVGAWKTHTAVQDLQLHLRGTGRFIVRLGMHRIGHAQRWLVEQVVTLTPDADVQIDVDSWAKLESGMLYFALEALEAGSVTAGQFATCTAPQREVKLGIVITHFNRKQWVLPAIARIRHELLSDPLYQGRIELVVVDNSQNITAEEAQGITLIPNKNLGGSGGFTRGLLHLKDQLDFTHCLFMDDDASCEIESIRRTFQLLSYAQTERFAIAGALLRELEPFRMWEKGAKFDGVCRALKSNLDVRQPFDLLLSEVKDQRPDFGAWWFFAFPVNDVKNYPFPFFVRGDDVLFGLSNDFHIETLNGIACWGDDFALKAGPLTFYLDIRNHILQYMRLNKGLIYSLRKIFGFFMSSALSCNYSSARAISETLSDVLVGPKFWLLNMDMSSIRSRIGKYASSEKLMHVDKSKYNLKYSTHRESWYRKVIRIVTVNGFFIPTFLLRDDFVFQHKNFRASFREIFRYKSIYYEYEPSGDAYIARHDKKTFFKELAIFAWRLAVFSMNYSRLRNLYKKEMPNMMSESFWRDVYSK